MTDKENAIEKLVDGAYKLYLEMKYGDANDLLDKAKELDHDLADAYSNKGLILQKFGRPEAAKICFDEYERLTQVN